jgi:hypothetical protein
MDLDEFIDWEKTREKGYLMAIYYLYVPIDREYFASLDLFPRLGTFVKPAKPAGCLIQRCTLVSFLHSYTIM